VLTVMAGTWNAMLSSPLPSVLTVVGAALLALAANEVAFHLVRRARDRWAITLSAAIVDHCWWPARVTVVAVAVSLTLPALHLRPATEDTLARLDGAALVAGVAWLLVAVSFALEDLALARFRVDVRDNLKARRITTQIMVLRRLTVVVACILAGAIMLVAFTDARDLGTSILASAGIAGVVIGLAARPIITNLLAGIQMLFSEPIRVDDVVVVLGQWGRVEEITFTYVVVHIWDDRRLVLAISYCREQPFENWTRTSAGLLGTVEVTVDYTAPVDAIREELGRILDASTLWDRRAWNLQVTDSAQAHVTLRALMSAPDAPTAWDLRCEVREKLIAHLQERYPDSLPRTRVAMVESDRRVPAPGPDGHPPRAAGTGPPS